MARNQSGRLSGSICRNSKVMFFSRNTIAARCTQGQVLKLARRYVVIDFLTGLFHFIRNLLYFNRQKMIWPSYHKGEKHSTDADCERCACEKCLSHPCQLASM